jgi:hypothetical protein
MADAYHTFRSRKKCAHSLGYIYSVEKYHRKGNYCDTQSLQAILLFCELDPSSDFFWMQRIDALSGIG